MAQVKVDFVLSASTEINVSYCPRVDFNLNYITIKATTCCMFHIQVNFSHDKLNDNVL